jgi:hypothetical protein
MNQDLLDFIEENPWFIKPTDQVMVQEYFPNGLQFHTNDKGFTSKYPKLTLLLNQARITELSISNNSYKLYTWDNQEGNTMGWLSPLPSLEQPPSYLHEDHRLLLKYFGGIKEHWNNSIEFYEGEFDTWIANLNSAMCLEDSIEGFKGWEKGYEEECKRQGMKQIIKSTDYISFAFEANGNLTAYHKQTSELLLFAHDHAFDYVIPVKDTPAYTFYHFKGCQYFSDWVEQVAQQWIERIKLKNGL